MVTANFNPADPSTYSSQEPTVNVGNLPSDTPTPTVPDVAEVPVVQESTSTPTQQGGGVVVSSAPAEMQFAQNSAALQQMLNNLGQGIGEVKPFDEKTYSDPFTQSLDKLAKTSDESAKALIATIQAQKMQQKFDLTKTYDNYKRGLQLLGIQHNEAQFTPDQLYGKVLAAENEFQQKINRLDAEEAKALMDAKLAREEKNLSFLKEKMNYIKQIKKEKNDALKDLYERMSMETKIADIQAGQIYDQLQKLPASQKESFLSGVASRFGIPLATLVQAVANEKTDRAKGKKSTGTGGSGKFVLSQAISTVTPQLNAIKGEDGYIDPYKWMIARDKWMQAGGTLANFKSNFKHLVNPESYDLVGL